MFIPLGISLVPSSPISPWSLCAASCKRSENQKTPGRPSFSHRTGHKFQVACSSLERFRVAISMQDSQRRLTATCDRASTRKSFCGCGSGGCGGGGCGVLKAYTGARTKGWRFCSCTEVWKQMLGQDKSSKQPASPESLRKRSRLSQLARMPNGNLTGAPHPQ